MNLSFPIHIHFTSHGNFNDYVIALCKCIIKILLEFKIKVKFLCFDGDLKMTSEFIRPALNDIISTFIKREYQKMFDVIDNY
jgi:hypothetical protein